MINDPYNPHLSKEYLPKDGKLLKAYRKWLKRYKGQQRQGH